MYLIKDGEHRKKHHGEENISMEGPQQLENDLDLKCLKGIQTPDLCCNYQAHIAVELCSMDTNCWFHKFSCHPKMLWVVFTISWQQHMINKKLW